MKNRKISLYFAFVNIGSTPIQSWSVICGIPDKTHAFNCGPWRDKNLWRASSVKLSDESKSSAIKLRALPISIHDFKTESLKPLFWPADRNLNGSLTSFSGYQKKSFLFYLKLGIRVNRSIRHSVDKSVAVISSSCKEHLSHSTSSTYSDFKPVR